MCPFKELATAIAKIQDCLSDLDNNKLKLNKEKTEVFYLYSKHSPIKSLPPLCFGNGQFTHKILPEYRCHF